MRSTTEQSGVAPVSYVRTGAQTLDDTELLERARRLHARVPLIDGHNDLPWVIRQHAQGDLLRMNPTMALTAHHTDVARLREGGVGGVFWAAYVPSSVPGDSAVTMALEQIDLILRMVARTPELEMAYSADDIERIHRGGRIASLIGVEGGHAIGNSLAVLRMFHALGARYLTLTHADTTDWADAATDVPRHGGLSPFGGEVLREMNRLGMLIDISHVSDEAMHAAIEISEAPIAFTHSSARALADHVRNVPDDVLRALAARGGVTMVNFFSGFVDARGAEVARGMFDVYRHCHREFGGDEQATRAAFLEWTQANPLPQCALAVVADHIEHIVEVAGIDHVGLGSDFDGVSELPVGLEDVSGFPLLTAELLRRGFSDEAVEKVMGGNLLRVLRAVEATAARLQREREPSSARFEGPV
jgi:membrane dipeptidase